MQGDCINTALCLHLTEACSWPQEGCVVPPTPALDRQLRDPWFRSVFAQCYWLGLLPFKGGVNTSPGKPTTQVST